MAKKIARAKRATGTTPVRALTHPSDSRANIPTAELESFARPEEKRPATVRYPRDPTLLVEELRAESEGRRTEQQLGFFGPYSDLSFEEKVDFYRHAGKWTNRMILGDSLLVMTSLAEKEGLKGQVQTIYVDPPYGIKFGSNWQVSTRKRDVRDGKDTAGSCVCRVHSLSIACRLIRFCAPVQRMTRPNRPPSSPDSGQFVTSILDNLVAPVADRSSATSC